MSTYYSNKIGALAMSILDEIKEYMVKLDSDMVPNLVKKALKQGFKPVEILNALTDGIRIVGDLYEKGEYFVSDLLMSAEIFKEAMALLEPLILKESAGETIARVVIGTVEGDIHDIGKNLVITMLKVNGFDVIDLGVDVPSQKFVDAVKQYKPDIVGMSALLTTTMWKMKEVIDALKREGLRDKVKIIVGGAVITEEFAKEIGADAYAKDAVTAVKVCKKLAEEQRKAK